MAFAEPTAVGVRPVDRRGSIVARPRLRTRTLDEVEANGGARSRALGCASTAAHVAWPRRVGRVTAAAISHTWRNVADPLVARRPLPRRAQVFDRVRGSGTGGRFSSFLIKIESFRF